MKKLCAAALLLAALAITVDAPAADRSLTPPRVAPSPLFAIDQHRDTVVDRVVSEWGDKLLATGAGVNREQLREMLFAMRADQLLAASLAGSINGLRDVLATALTAPTTPKPSLRQVKALGDAAEDVVYTPVMPCRLVETRGTFAAVYQGGGAFSGGEIRNYTIQGSNGVCLAQLPAGLSPSAVQLQVFGIPINSGASGDIEILPQGSTFGATATEVYVGNVAFNTVSTTAKINLTSNQIGVQVRGGGANLAIDVVGYFRPPLDAGTGAFQVVVGGNVALQITPDAVSPIVVAGSSANIVTPGASGASINGGGAAGTAPPGAICPVSCANRVTDAFGTIGGGISNQAGDNAGTASDIMAATVGGGTNNVASGVVSSVGGGANNIASALASTVGAGDDNIANGSFSTIGGGNSNHASADSSTVGGGVANIATAERATVGGGGFNGANGIAATVGGGFNNFATDNYATVGGGNSNVAAASAVVAGGQANQASGNNSSVAGGRFNVAAGDYSFVSGRQAKNTNTAHTGVFMFADANAVNFVSQTANEFGVRATGGVRFVTAIDGAGLPTAGVTLAAGSGTWSNLSDRAAKRDLVLVDPLAVVSKVAAMPLYSWRYVTEVSGARHMGPTAQDFRSAFGLGDNDMTITTVDAEGVAFAAIQGLSAKVDEQQHEITELRVRVAAAETSRITALEQQVSELQSVRGELAALKATVAELAGKTKIARAEGAQ